MRELYNYDVQGYYTTQTYARLNPLVEGGYLYPARSVDVPPPFIGPNQIARWTGTAWAVDVDYRGKWWDVDTQSEVAVWDAGEPQPTNTTNVPPPPNEPNWKFTGTAWERTLEVAKQEKTTEILNGYSQARSTPTTYEGHQYSREDVFILLMLGAIDVTSMGGMVTTFDVDHNIVSLPKPQAEDLRDLVYTQALSMAINRETKLKAIEDATDIATVDAISW